MTVLSLCDRVGHHGTSAASTTAEGRLASWCEVGSQLIHNRRCHDLTDEDP
jgi:hypothetical protein